MSKSKLSLAMFFLISTHSIARGENLVPAASEILDQNLSGPLSPICDETLTPPERSWWGLLKTPRNLHSFNPALVSTKNKALKARLNELSKAMTYREKSKQISEIEVELSKASAELMSLIKRRMAEDPRGAFFPLVILGGGTHAAIMRLAAAQLGIETLTLEASNSIQHQRLDLLRGSAQVENKDIKPLILQHSPVQVPFLTTSPQPRAADLRKVVIAAHGAAAGGLLLNTSISSNQILQQADSSFVIETENGLKIHTLMIVNTSPLTEKLPESLKGSNRGQISDLRKTLSPLHVPRFMFLKDYWLQMSRFSNQFHHDLPYNESVVTVIGHDAEAMDIIRNFQGKGPKDLYPPMSHKVAPKKIVWITQTPPPSDFNVEGVEVIVSEVTALEPTETNHNRVTVYLKDQQSFETQFVISSIGFNKDDAYDLFETANGFLSPHDFGLQSITSDGLSDPSSTGQPLALKMDAIANSFIAGSAGFQLLPDPKRDYADELRLTQLFCDQVFPSLSSKNVRPPLRVEAGWNEN